MTKVNTQIFVYWPAQAKSCGTAECPKKGNAHMRRLVCFIADRIPVPPRPVHSLSPCAHSVVSVNNSLGRAFVVRLQKHWILVYNKVSIHNMG